MASSLLTGLATGSFNGRGRDIVKLTITRLTGPGKVITGFSDDDDALQIRQAEAGVSYSKGAYVGNISVNLNTNILGEVVFKLSEPHEDNVYMSNWYKITQTGVLDPGIIICTTATHRHMAFQCLPTMFAEVSSFSAEDPGVEWTLTAGSVTTFESLEGISTAAFDIGIRI